MHLKFVLRHEDGVMVPMEKQSSANLGLFGASHVAIDPSSNHGIGILTQLDAFTRRQEAQLVTDPVLKELAQLIVCEAHPSQPHRMVVS